MKGVRKILQPVLVFAVIIPFFIFGVWYLITLLSNTNSLAPLHEFFSQYWNIENFAEFVFLGVVAQYGLSIIALASLLMIIALPKLAFEIDNEVYDLIMIIVCGVVVLGVAVFFFVTTYTGWFGKICIALLGVL